MRIISPQSSREFELYFQLRWKILRAPFNQPCGSEKDDYDEHAFHLMAINDKNEIIGVSRLHDTNQQRTAQIRYMAIDTKYQNQGVGSLLLQQLEKHAIAHDFKKIMLNARYECLGFYLKLGYHDTGEESVLYNIIKHRKMEKLINKS